MPNLPEGKDAVVNVQYSSLVYPELSPVFGGVIGIMMIILGVVIFPLTAFTAFSSAKNLRVISFVYILDGTLFLLWALGLVITYRVAKKFDCNAFGWSKVFFGIFFLVAIAFSLWLLVEFGRALS